MHHKLWSLKRKCQILTFVIINCARSYVGNNICSCCKSNTEETHLRSIYIPGMSNERTSLNTPGGRSKNVTLTAGAAVIGGEHCQSFRSGGRTQRAHHCQDAVEFRGTCSAGGFGSLSLLWKNSRTQKTHWRSVRESKSLSHGGGDF